MKPKMYIFGLILLATTSLAQSKDFTLTWARWSVFAQGVLLDSQTGLQWTQEDNGSDINWNDAQQYCRSSTWARGGWRLPSVDELAAIYDEKAPGFTCATFEGKALSCKASPLFHLTSSMFWSGTSSEPASDGSARAWEVLMLRGARLAGGVSFASPNRALCVRQP